MEAYLVSSKNFTKDKASGIEFRPVTRGEYSSIMVCKTSSPSTDKHNNSLYWEQMKLIDDNKPYYERDLTYNQGKFSDDWDEEFIIFGDTLRNFIKSEEVMFKIKQHMFYIITEESAKIISRRIGKHMYDHGLYKQARLKPLLNSKEAQDHFGDILSNLNFNESYRRLLESFHSHTPSVQEVQNFKLTPKEQKIVDALVEAAKIKRGYSVNTELVNYLENENEGGLYHLVKEMFSKYIGQIAGKFNFDEDGYATTPNYNEDHAIKNMIRSEIMQPYMNADVLYNLVYDNPEIDVNDLEGLLSTGVRRKGQEAKEYVGQNTSGKINTTLYLFMFYKHEPETMRKVAEVFVKYAILANFKNTDYMFERSLKPATQKHFGGIIGNL